MNLVRATVFAAAALLLGGGYFASQNAFLSGKTDTGVSATEVYARAIDTAPVKVLALVILVVCVLMASAPQSEATK